MRDLTVLALELLKLLSYLVGCLLNHRTTRHGTLSTAALSRSRLEEREAKKAQTESRQKRKG
jgi:hypothetical protein